MNSPEAGHAGLDVETMDERLGIDSLPLCMSLPSFVRPHRGRAASGLNDFRFQAFCRPFAHSRRNGRFVRMHAENAQRGSAMMRRIGMESTVGGFIIAGNGVPQRRDFPADRMQALSKPKRTLAAVGVDRRGRAVEADEIGNGQSRCRDRSGREISDRKHRAKSSGIGERNQRFRIGVAAQFAPDLGQERSYQGHGAQWACTRRTPNDRPFAARGSRASAREHDEFCSAAGLAARRLVGDEE